MVLVHAFCMYTVYSEGPTQYLTSLLMIQEISAIKASLVAWHHCLNAIVVHLLTYKLVYILIQDNQALHA
jgi:hypothetical protein